MIFSLFSQYAGNMIGYHWEKSDQSAGKNEMKYKDQIYLKNFNMTFSLLKRGFNKNSKIMQEYLQAWEKAVEGDENINDVVDKKYFELEKAGVLKELENNKNQIQESMLLLQYPGEDFKKGVSTLLDYYELYLKQYSYIQNPRGSYEEYILLVKNIELQGRNLEEQIEKR